MSVTQSDVDALLAAAVDENIDAAGVSASDGADPDDGPAPAAGSNRKRHAVQHNGPLGRILHLSVPVMVTLAEQKMPINRVLSIAVGAIIEFDRRFDCDLELVVSNKVIGRGQPIKVGENFGLRITRMGGLDETIRALGGA